MPKLDRPAIAQLRELLAEYEQEIDASRYAPKWKPQQVGQARRFVDWLAGEFVPGEFEPKPRAG